MSELIRVLRMLLVVGGTLAFLACDRPVQAFFVCLIGIYVEVCFRGSST